MTEDEFWRIIQDAHDRGDAVEHVRATLRSLSGREIVSFNDMLRRKIADACIFPLLAANFVIASYVSDDGFRQFRAWLVAQGKDRYTAALGNPDSIADWLDENDVEDLDGEWIVDAARHAYQTHGTDGEFYDRIAFLPDPTIETNWPEDKAEYRQRFPRLVGKFWNQRRINELHSD